MSGGGKASFSKGDDKSKESATAKAGPMPTMKTFGGVLDPAVTAQLQAGGLLGTMPEQSPYSPVTVPILQTPDEVVAYLKSKGKKVA